MHEAYSVYPLLKLPLNIESVTSHGDHLFLGTRLVHIFYSRVSQNRLFLGTRLVHIFYSRVSQNHLFLGTRLVRVQYMYCLGGCPYRKTFYSVFFPISNVS